MNDKILNRLKTQVDGAIQPLRASSWHKRKVREELLAHVTAVFEEEFAQLADEKAALEKTMQRFGDPAELATQLQESITILGYIAWFLESTWLLRGEAIKVNHNRLYVAMFIVMWLYTLCGLVLLSALMNIPADAQPRMLLPDWSQPLLAAINGFYLIVMLATLICRQVRPELGRRMTKVLNVLFLIGPPFATALGIYGLWTVDKSSDIGVVK